MAIGINNNAVVELDKTELNNAPVNAKENIIPLGVLGNMVNNLLEIYLCKLVFCVAMAIINPPKNKNMVGLE